ncbi:NAD(P)-binding protein [Rothia terrae]|uniref:NAD(P)-binding protein n=1 Tax=Rothia terrae TaxID=396015 RepID=UPI0031DCD3EE
MVIGAGQSGLTASYELKRRGIDHIVLDANSTPGGAWQHHWNSLTMNDVHRVADLPGAPAPDASPAQSNKAIPDYFARYEKEFELPVVRPVKVTSVRNAEENPQLLEVQSENDHG